MTEEASSGDSLYIEGALLESIRRAFEQHDAEGLDAPYLILLNPSNYGLLGWDEVLGLPVLPDDRVAPMRCRLVCGAAGWAGTFEERVIWWVEGRPYVVLEDDGEQQAA